MADYNPSTIRGRTGEATGVRIDEGLRAYMLGVYNYMALGVAFTAVVILALGTQPELLFEYAASPLKWVAFAGVLALGWFSPRIILGGSTFAAHLCYWSYAALWGLLIAPMVVAIMSFVPDGVSLVMRAFFITAGTFGAMSLFGYTTKRDLGPMSAFLCMATFGLLIAMLLNVFFFQSDFFSIVTSLLVVLIFAGITAWETQEIRRMYYEGDGAAVQTRKSIFGAFMLYGSFVVLFNHILYLLYAFSSD